MEHSYNSFWAKSLVRTSMPAYTKKTEPLNTLMENFYNNVWKNEAFDQKGLLGLFIGDILLTFFRTNTKQLTLATKLAHPKED